MVVDVPIKALVLTALISVLDVGVAATAAPVCPTPLAFRLDDVQDHWLSDAQKAVIRLFSEEGLPLTLGIIGGFFGEDHGLVDTIRSRLGQIEIANHGYHAKDARNGKSILLSQSSSAIGRQIGASNGKIRKLLGVTPKVFIPHRNQFDTDVLQALSSQELQYISSACSWHIDRGSVCEDTCGYPGERSCREPDPYGMVHVPVGASTQWEPSPGKGSADPEDVLAEARKSTDQYGFAVVMLHPQDFVTSSKDVDPRALGALKKLLSRIRAAGEHRVVKLSDVARPCEPGL